MQAFAQLYAELSICTPKTVRSFWDLAARDDAAGPAHLARAALRQLRTSRPRLGEAYALDMVLRMLCGASVRGDAEALLLPMDARTGRRLVAQSIAAAFTMVCSDAHADARGAVFLSAVQRLFGFVT